jgi:hypothetical protein
MSASSITIPATLQSDSVTLRLDTPLSLPPGRVTVTVQTPDTSHRPGVLEVLDQIHRQQRESGRRPMTEEEMAAEIAAQRTEDEEYEQRWQALWSQTKTPPSGSL